MVGAEAVLETMKRLGAEDDRCIPAETLKSLAETGGRFAEVQPG